MCEGVSSYNCMLDWTVDWTRLGLILMIQIKQPYTHPYSKFPQNNEVISGSV